ncbi:hypothetical protein [Seohaeicola zhoushanensis]|uniref:Uncharacterized protein n=1 Tax=Seohaeicola zhoushanensis TaxID=1569283 RepID=A0A8J3H226_9RHOB|nr:hypothetical protein [Seohaeicola zhoushanensis]GHF69465.1 hypothetical protein GCM10017056_45710 [Seohaeicola zhoushanensis]
MAVTAAEIVALIDREMIAWDADRRQREAADEQGAPLPARWYARTLEDFRAALCPPETVEVQFSGGITQTCWAVTRAEGPYRVIYLPSAGYFALCVESRFGPLDIGVHGGAIDCYASV